MWTREELQRIGEICFRYGVKVVSDEIHSDFTYPGHVHTVFASLGETFGENTITCTSPSKTFNLAGLQVSNIFIADEGIRRKVEMAIEQTGYSQMNLFGIAACQTAYETGREWLDALKQYLEGNLHYVRGFLKENLPKLRLIEPEGTYLLWLDFRQLQLTDRELDRMITEQAKLWLDAGVMFGPEGSGFQRMNIACPRETLVKALQQLKSCGL